MDMDLFAWTDLVLPAACAGCRRPGTRLCAACRNGLLGACPSLAPPPTGVPLLAVVGDYRGMLRDAVLAHKARPSPPVGAALAEALGKAWSLLRSVLAESHAHGHEWAHVRAGSGALRVPPMLILAVPIPPSRRLSRRRPVAELLAAPGWPSRGLVLTEALAPVGVRRPQKQLSAAARSRNMAGALRCRRIPPELRGRPVVLVDDIVTTGASLSAGSAELTRAGLEVVGALGLARAVEG